MTTKGKQTKLPHSVDDVFKHPNMDYIIYGWIAALLNSGTCSDQESARRLQVFLSLEEDDCSIMSMLAKYYRHKNKFRGAFSHFKLTKDNFELLMDNNQALIEQNKLLVEKMELFLKRENANGKSG